MKLGIVKYMPFSYLYKTPRQNGVVNNVKFGTAISLFFYEIKSIQQCCAKEKTRHSIECRVLLLYNFCSIFNRSVSHR